VAFLHAAFALVGVLSLFAGLVWLERRGDEVVVVALLFGLVVVEVAVYGSQNAITGGVFHPSLAGQTLRLHELLIVVALAARFIAKGIPRSISIASIGWAIFLLWIITAAVMGRLGGNPQGLVIFEAKAAIYLGAFALTAGVAPNDYLERRPFKVVVVLAAVLAAILSVLQITGTRIYTSLPGLPLPASFDPENGEIFHSGFGGVGADAATVFSSLAIVIFAYAMCQRSRRTPLLLLVAPLGAAGVLSNQRAVLLGLSASLATLTVLFLLRQDRVRLTGAQAILAVCAVVALLVGPTFATAALGSSNPKAPFSGAYRATFAGKGEQQSAQNRFNQWTAATDLIEQRPLFGWGLGKVYPYYDEGTRSFVTTGLTHNIGLDLLLRTGIVGLTFFVVALGASIVGGVGTWRYHLDDGVAAIAAACVAVILGLAAKGMVESIFEKYRLAVFLGLTLGVLLRAAASLERRPVPKAALQGRTLWT
jgi:O-antigen ligase